MDANPTTLVPPRRFGSLLRHARTSSGIELEKLALISNFGVVELEDIEQGRQQLDDQQLAEILSLYGIENAELVPERSQLIIDLDHGRIAVDQADITVGPSANADAVLTRYLALVYRLRDLPLGTPLHLRDLDLDVLSTALSLEPATVESRLEQLMLQRDVVLTDQRRLRRRLLVPLAGVVVAATAVGVLVLVSQTTGDTTPVDTKSPATQVTTDIGAGAAVVENPAAQVTTDIGNGGAVEVNPDAGTGG